MSAMEHNVRLVALNNGLFPHADPIVCDDLTGPLSLLGESATVPRYLDICTLCDSATARTLNDGRSVVLWRNDSPKAEPIMAVAATTYLTGACTSTFDVAWQILEKGLLPEWGSVVSPVQKSGRGQLRRQWHSPRGNLYVTFRLPDDPNLQGDAAALVAGYILARSFVALGFSLQLKWPNDLLAVNGKKVGGILLEERDGILLAGLGVNIVEAPSHTQMRPDHTTSASVLFPDEEGPGDEPLAPFALWQSLVERCIMEYTGAVAGRDLEGVLLAASTLLAWRGKLVNIFDCGELTHSGECAGIGPRGGLLMHIKGAGSVEVCSGSVCLA